MAGRGSAGTVVEDDAPIGNSSSQGNGGSQRTPLQQTRDGPKRAVSQDTRAFKSQRLHNIGSNGRALTNRKGKPLCAEFQTGACLECVPGRGPTCVKDPNKMHQCEICLSPQHGASFLKPCKQPLVKAPTLPTSSSSGKGNRKGKGKSKSSF